MYQVNHLSHFLMTIELLPVILDTAASCGDCRIVILSSSAHQYGVFEPDNMNCDKGPYDTMSGNNYDRSKLYNVSLSLIVVYSYVSQVMHGFALQRRLKDVGVTVSVVHPGFVSIQMIECFIPHSSLIINNYVLPHNSWFVLIN
jgi:NAD(P)-dependent dehydrogenase (short-subunit alcohol dehydrogenase family)